ncbi:hypothetical protein DSD89_15625 [Salmonella enterica]|nr:hypothetical protein [Salmonella enterica]
MFDKLRQIEILCQAQPYVSH